MTSCEREWLLCLFMMDVVGLCGSIDGSLCETECGFVCVSVWLRVSLSLSNRAVGECECFPRGQPPVGLLSRNALRCEISL